MSRLITQRSGLIPVIQLFRERRDIVHCIANERVQCQIVLGVVPFGGRRSSGDQGDVDEIKQTLPVRAFVPRYYDHPAHWVQAS